MFSSIVLLMWEVFYPFHQQLRGDLSVRLINHSRDLKETGSATDHTRKLQLTAVDRSHAGTYQCVITNEFGAIKSSEATLTVLRKFYLFKLPWRVCFLI